MAAKPLEAIPEETVTPTTTERVTSDVSKTTPATAKHPGRVASGKRLAERNRLAREAKKQAKTQKPTTDTTTEASASANTTEQSSNNSTNTVYLILAVGGLVVSAFGVYYQREAIMRTIGRSQKTAVESNTTTVDVVDPTPPPKPKVNVELTK